MLSPAAQQVYEEFKRQQPTPRPPPTQGPGLGDPIILILGRSEADHETTREITRNTEALNAANAAPARAAGAATGAQPQGLPWWVFPGMSPIVNQVIDLFTGSADTAAPAAPVRYVPPPAVAFFAANTAEGIRDADYGPGQALRTFSGPAAAQVAAPQVTVNVQAMDSRSFMDNADNIARAVREAMLNSHAINDLVAEL
jgi:hypothetical protein